MNNCMHSSRRSVSLFPSYSIFVWSVIGPRNSAGSRRRVPESGRAGESTTYTLGRPARGSAAATATAQVESSASVMRDTTVGSAIDYFDALMESIYTYFSLYLIDDEWTFVSKLRKCFTLLQLHYGLSLFISFHFLPSSSSSSHRNRGRLLPLQQRPAQLRQGQLWVRQCVPGELAVHPGRWCRQRLWAAVSACSRRLALF